MSDLTFVRVLKNVILYLQVCLRTWIRRNDTSEVAIVARDGSSELGDSSTVKADDAASPPRECSGHESANRGIRHGQQRCQLPDPTAGSWGGTVGIAETKATHPDAGTLACTQGRYRPAGVA